MFVEYDIIFTDIKIHIMFGILILIPPDKIKKEPITPATPYAPLYPHLSIPTASSHSQLGIYILSASVLGTGTSFSWTLGPVKSLLK